MRTKVVLFTLLISFISLIQATAQQRQSVFEVCGTEVGLAAETATSSLEEYRPLGWTVNCRYLLGRVPGSYLIWDSTTQTTSAQFEAYTPNAAIEWDTRGEYLIIPVSGEGTFLWNLTTDQKIRLNENPCGFFGNVVWDYARGVVLGHSPWQINRAWCSVNGSSSVAVAYDLSTGAVVAEYSGTSRDWISGYYINFEVTEDNRYVIVTSYNNGPVRVWDRDTGQSVTVNVNEGGGVAHTQSQIALSPDGRYLAIGMNYLRIWDLAALAPALREQQPNYRYEGPTSRIRSVSFVDNNLIETISADGVQRWNVVTGELVSEGEG